MWRHLKVIFFSLKKARWSSHSSLCTVASHAGVFRGARFVGRGEKRALPKTPAWEAMCTGEKEKRLQKLFFIHSASSRLHRSLEIESFLSQSNTM